MDRLRGALAGALGRAWEITASRKIVAADTGKGMHFFGVNKELPFKPPGPKGERFASFQVYLHPLALKPLPLFTQDEGSLLSKVLGRSATHRLFGGVIVPPRGDGPKLEAAIHRALGGWPDVGDRSVDAIILAVAKRLPATWHVWGVRKGKVTPTHWPAGQGLEIIWQRKGHTSIDWKLGKGGDVRVWVMDPSYRVAPPGEIPAQVGSAGEIKPWRGRRVLIWGSGGADWKRWRADLTNALAATKRTAGARLAARTEEDVRFFLGQLRQAKPGNQEFIVQSLARLGPPAVPFLIEAVKSKGKTREDANLRKGAVPALIAMVRANRFSENSHALTALGRIGPAAAPSVPLLIEIIRSKADASERRSAVRAIWGIGPAAKAAVPALIVAARGKSGLVRGDAIIALGRIGPDAKAAVPVLVEAVTDTSGQMAFDVSRSLAGIGDAAVPALVKAMKDPRPLTRRWAMRTLGRMGGRAKAAVPALIEVLKNAADYEDRLVALGVLGDIGPAAKAALPIIEDLIKRKKILIPTPTMRAPNPAAVIKKIQGAAPTPTKPVAAKTAWSKPIKALRARLTCEKGAFAVGEPVVLTVELQCFGEKDYTFPERTLRGCQLFPHLNLRVGVAAKRVRLAVFNRLSIPKGKVFRRRVRLSEWFTMDKPGRYVVRAGHSNGLVSDIGDWTGQVLSPPLQITIRRGPGGPGPAEARAIRQRRAVRKAMFETVYVLPDRPTALRQVIHKLRADSKTWIQPNWTALGKFGLKPDREVAVEADMRRHPLRNALGIVLTKLGYNRRVGMSAGRVVYLSSQEEINGLAGDTDAAAAREMVKALSGADAQEVARVTDALVSLGQAAVPALKEALKEPDERRRKAARKALQRIAVPPAKRPAALDLDAAAKLLTEKVGGKWEKAYKGTQLRGTVPAAGGNHARMFAVFPVPMNQPGQKRIAEFAVTVSAEMHLLGSNDKCTVLAWFKAAESEEGKAVFKALDLRPTKVTLRDLTRNEVNLWRYINALKTRVASENPSTLMTGGCGFGRGGGPPRRQLGLP